MHLLVPKAVAPAAAPDHLLTAAAAGVSLLPLTLLAIVQQVRETGSQQSPYIEQLKAAQEAAQSAGKGLYNKVGGALSRRVCQQQQAGQQQ
jgi:endonuclease YncB( thermonuclease family)